MKRPTVQRAAEGTERMPVGMADAAPVLEADAELVGGLRVLDEVGEIDTEKSEQIDDGRDGRFADPDRADLRRLDHREGEAAAGERASQPAVPPPTMAMLRMPRSPCSAMGGRVVRAGAARSCVPPSLLRPLWEGP